MELHAYAERIFSTGDPSVLIGVGSDVAAVRTVGNCCVLKVDPTIEGVHFERGFREARVIACKAIRRAASDFAAAAAHPRWALLSVELPKHVKPAFARSLIRALRDEARGLGIHVVGGHTGIGSRDVLGIHVFLAGSCQGKPLERGGARPGDILVATGSFGGSILGAHLRPNPRLREMQALRRAVNIHAAIDISDGLSLDCWRLARASKIAVVLDVDRIPIAPAARTMARTSGRSALEHALGDGEDFEIVAAIPRSALANAAEAARKLRVKLTAIGECGRGAGLWFRRGDGPLRKCEPSGYVQRSEAAPRSQSGPGRRFPIPLSPSHPPILHHRWLDK